MIRRHCFNCNERWIEGEGDLPHKKRFALTAIEDDVFETVHACSADCMIALATAATNEKRSRPRAIKI